MKRWPSHGFPGSEETNWSSNKAWKDSSVLRVNFTLHRDINIQRQRRRLLYQGGLSYQPSADSPGTFKDRGGVCLHAGAAGGLQGEEEVCGDQVHRKRFPALRSHPDTS
jgi:hypothetical protein